MNIFELLEEKKIRMENIKEIKLKKDNGRCDKIIFEMPEISLDKISCSYIGKAHSCMCGCSGKYSYLKSSQESAGKERGYEVDDEEICERSVKFILKKLKKEEKRGIEVIEDYIYSIDIEDNPNKTGRTYVLYLKK